jgi:hypothetical protein
MKNLFLFALLLLPFALNACAVSQEAPRTENRAVSAADDDAPSGYQPEQEPSRPTPNR